MININQIEKKQRILIKCGDLLKHKDQPEDTHVIGMVVTVGEIGIVTGTWKLTHQFLSDTGLYSRDGGVTWNPCSELFPDGCPVTSEPETVAFSER